MESPLDITLRIASVNGSGTQSANQVLTKTFFRMGYFIGAKNLFPSNIAGLPTWYNIRVNEKPYTSRKEASDVLILMNPKTWEQDLEHLKPGGLCVISEDLRVSTEQLRTDVTNVSLPCKKLVTALTKSVKIKKYLANMIYVGAVCELLGADFETLQQVIKDQFPGKTELVELNTQATLAGQKHIQDNFADIKLNSQLSKSLKPHTDQLLLDGNTASAMGLVTGGCGFMAWYPITPSSSVAEGFQHFASQWRVDNENKNHYSVVQAEDELSAISMVLGAGWAGARAATATSGPGLSLMAEAAGLSYFAEIPAVIWNVQRVGPSTGLPTRTLQGDLASSYTLSHGDTEHIVLLPGNLEECFEFGQIAFDLSERIQSLVIVLSDLDLGMNLTMTNTFKFPEGNFDRGKVLNAEQLEAIKQKGETFGRYKDTDDDGIPYRTLPNTHHPDAAFFTRGTGHDEYAKYTEDNENYRKLLDRLKKKYVTAQTYIPKPIIEANGSEYGVIYYGSSQEALHETLNAFAERGQTIDSLRLRALPLTKEVEDFIQSHKKVYVIEQNRDAQLLSLLRQKLSGELSSKCESLLQYDGLPLSAEYVTRELNGMMEAVR